MEEEIYIFCGVSGKLTFIIDLSPHLGHTKRKRLKLKVISLERNYEA